MWKSLKLLAQGVQFWFHSPFEFDEQAMEFVTRKFTKKLRPWLLVQVCVVVQLLPSCLLLYMPALGYSSALFSVFNILIYLVYVMLSMGSLIAEVIVNKHKNALVWEFKAAKEYERKISTGRFKQCQEYKFYGVSCCFLFAGGTKYGRYHDVMGLFLYITTMTSAVCPFLFLIVLNLLDVNSLSHFYMYFFPERKIAGAVIRRSSDILTFIASTQYFRIVITTIVTAVIRCYINLSSASKIRRFKQYNELHIIIRTVEQANANLCFVFHIIGFASIVAMSFALVKLQDYLPLPIFLWVLTGDLMFIFGISKFMPMLAGMHEISTPLLQRWHLALPGKWIRYWGRKLKSAEPYRFYAGPGDFRLYYNERSTKTTYYRIILNHTIDLILAVKPYRFNMTLR